MKEPEMKQVGHWIAQALNSRNDASALSRIRREVLELADAFPLYAERRERVHAGVQA
jgi:glycine hydroxymethyltransferase